MLRESRPVGRNRVFDLLRILFATLVLLAHAPELTDGNRSREILTRITHSNVTFGSMGVDGFFLLSGFLIVQSWQRDPELLNFVRKRLLRIVPGYLVAVFLSTLAVGLVAPAVPHFFRSFTLDFPISILLLDAPKAPPVFRSFVNGSLWTIAYEFRCYLLVAVCGVLGVLRRPILWLAGAVVLLGAANTYAVGHLLAWDSFFLLAGVPAYAFRLTATFLVGGCFYLFRERIPFRPIFAVGAAVLLSVLLFLPRTTEPALIVFGGYLLFYLGQVREWSLRWFAGVPDISYGIYLYGWPVQILWIYLVHGSPWVTFGASTVLCFGLGWMSWHFVERPMLTLKRRATAPLPPP